MRTLITVLAGVAVATAVAAPPLASASSTHATAHRSASRMTLTVHPTGGGQVDVGRPGLSLGDEFFEHGTVSGGAHGTYSLSGELIQLPGAATPPRESQHFTLRLRGGTIEAIGQHAAVDDFTVAVVGGTGPWRHAAGTLHVAHGRMHLSLDR
jgi:hypothetical protein